jgi:transcriptional regulator GlxA family with amidase domain
MRLRSASTWGYFAEILHSGIAHDGDNGRARAQLVGQSQSGDDDAAPAAGASKRTLARRMHSVQGKSPVSYFQELRVERAVHLLKTTDESFEEIAARVGYSDGVTLRTLLRHRLGHGIKEIRRSAA